MKMDAAESIDQRTENDAVHHLVIFEAGGRQLAFEADEVIEILQPAALSPLPESRAGATGALDVRGEVLIVFDLRGLLGMAVRPWTRRTRIMIIAGPHGKAGLIVDAVTEVTEAAASQIVPVPPLALGLDTRMMKGILRHAQAIVPILAVAEVLREVAGTDSDSVKP
jgi:chemotaxis signal transduction protein